MYVSTLWVERTTNKSRTTKHFEKIYVQINQT